MKELLPALCGVAALAAFSVPEAPAQTYPSHPIQVIVPATPGGPADTAIRIIEPELSSVLGTPLVLVNRPGASGIVGMSSVATAAPNGYTIGAGVNSICGNQFQICCPRARRLKPACPPRLRTRLDRAQKG
jgi:tripartite-type tricarboxylate transporter receptor subunit TctC